MRYDERRHRLDVKFATGVIYRYSGVERWEYEELLAAESIGTWFNTVFKKRGHSYQKIYQPPDLPRHPPSPPRQPAY